MIVLPIRFSQFDSRWCTHLLGNNTDPQYIIKDYGCLLCCLAMVLKYYGYDTDPDRLNDQLKGNGGFGEHSGLYNWGTLQKVIENVSDNNTVTPDLLTDAQMGEIKAAIDKGYPVIVELDYNPKTVALDMHFVVIVGYNPSDENDFTVADPLGGTLHSLKDYLGWYKPNARSTIQSYAVCSGPIPQLSDGTAVTVSSVVFPQLVHGSTQWDMTVNKYMNGKDPKTTQFEDLDSVIGGIKSTATAANNAVIKQQAALATAQQTASNLQEQLTHVEQERQADKDSYIAQVDALTPNSDATKKLISGYESRIQGYQDKITQLMKDKHDLSVANAQIKAKQTVSIGDLLLSYIPDLSAIIQRFKSK